MGKDISIDYGRVNSSCDGLTSAINTGFGNTKDAYSKVISGLSKTKGDYVDALKLQVEADKKIASSLTKATGQLACSIKNAANSLKTLDINMKNKM